MGTITMGMNFRHRHAPALVVAAMVIVSMIMCGQYNVHRWVADIVTILDSIALLVVAVWCGTTEVMRYFR
jgi:preprotein translocase subunit SecD